MDLSERIMGIAPMISMVTKSVKKRFVELVEAEEGKLMPYRRSDLAKGLPREVE